MPETYILFSKTNTSWEIFHAYSYYECLRIQKNHATLGSILISVFNDSKGNTLIALEKTEKRWIRILNLPNEVKTVLLLQGFTTEK